jgi:hypothetical protein
VNELPEQFSDLESLIEWSLPTERARNAKRRSSSMEQLKHFYDTMLPRTEAVLEHLDKFPLEQMPEQERRLLYLALSLAEVANAIELFKNPSVIDGFDPDRVNLMHE